MVILLKDITSITPKTQTIILIPSDRLTDVLMFHNHVYLPILGLISLVAIKIVKDS